MDRREFLAASTAALAWPALGRAAARSPRALVTADTEAHVVAMRLSDGRVLERIATREGPRSIERHGRGPAIVGHATEGVVTLLDPDALRVRRVLGGFGEPRYTAIGRDGAVAYVTDSAHGELAVVDLVRGRVVHRLEVGAGARHCGIDPRRRRVWVALGSSASELVVVNVDEPSRPRIARHIRPPFLAHDVAFSPSGRRVWVTAGREPRLAVYPAHGDGPPQLLGGDAAPQHVAFGPTFAYVASGNGRVLRLYPLSGGRSRTVPTSLGAFNVVRGAGSVLTPSLGDGTLTVVDPHGRVRRRTRVARAAHDVCVA
jgi:DNA-binding beta-propeller fold protein YncE